MHITSYLSVACNDKVEERGWPVPSLQESLIQGIYRELYVKPPSLLDCNSTWASPESQDKCRCA